MQEDAVRFIAITVTSVATTTPCVKRSKCVGMLWVFVISSKRLQRSGQSHNFHGMLNAI